MIAITCSCVWTICSRWRRSALTVWKTSTTDSARTRSIVFDKATNSLMKHKFRKDHWLPMYVPVGPAPALQCTMMGAVSP